MSSIGPQLPPHLAQNANEIDLDSDEDYGPSPAIGPTAPEAQDADEDSGHGPAAPPPRASAGPSPRRASPNPQNADEIGLDSDSDYRRSIGPPQNAESDSHGPSTAPAEDSDSDSDSDFGPSLPTTAAKRPIAGPSLPSSTSPAPQRDEWMLAPPPTSTFSERDRPRPRKFLSSAKPTVDASIWTETPEQKLQRLRDSVLGRQDPGESQNPKESKREERDEVIAANIQAQRGQSLYDLHRKRSQDQPSRKRMKPNQEGEKGGREEEEDDDPSKRAFDREKDMALGTRVSASQRRELITKSANFGGRFSKGSYL